MTWVLQLYIPKISTLERNRHQQLQNVLQMWLSSRADHAKKLGHSSSPWTALPTLSWIVLMVSAEATTIHNPNLGYYGILCRCGMACKLDPPFQTSGFSKLWESTKLFKSLGSTPHRASYTAKKGKRREVDVPKRHPHPIATVACSGSRSATGQSAWYSVPPRDGTMERP